MSDKYYITPNQLYYDSLKLGRMIKENCDKPDIIIGLWRGGSTIAITIHEYLKYTGWDINCIPIKCSSYTGIENQNERVKIDNRNFILSNVFPKSNVLVIDDVFDSGKTAQEMKLVLDALNAKMIFATLYWKPKNNQTKLEPDFYVGNADDKWIVFPHEMDGLTKEELKEKDSNILNFI